jgi:hypothetical protein
MGEINFSLKGHNYRLTQPVTITASAGIAGDKLKFTVQEVFPDRAPNSILEHDMPFTSLKDMAEYLYGLVRSVVIPRQTKANRKQGIDLAAPIVIGMRPEKFKELGNQVNNEDYPIRKLQKGRSVDNYIAEYLFRAVDKAYVDTGIQDPNAYIARYSSVSKNDQYASFKPDQFSIIVFNLLRVISLDENQKHRAEALAKLEEIAQYFGEANGHHLDKNYQNVRSTDPNDVANGNRFSDCHIPNLGNMFKVLLRNYGLRKHFVRAVKKQLGLRPDHVMCIKARGEASDRPLTNIAEAMALQVLVDKNLLKIDEVRDPYA